MKYLNMLLVYVQKRGRYTSLYNAQIGSLQHWTVSKVLRTDGVRRMFPATEAATGDNL